MRQNPVYRQANALTISLIIIPATLLKWKLLDMDTLRVKWISLVLILGASLAWIWFSRLPSAGAAGSALAAPRQGFTAPDFDLPSSTGENISLSSLKGKAVLVNFWASWCPPCQAEMPAIQRVYQEYRDQGLEVLAVNTTMDDDPQKARQFAEQMGLTFPVLFDTYNKTANAYQVRSLPSTYFIDPSGRIQEVVIGGPMAEALLRVRVEQALAGPGGVP